MARRTTPRRRHPALWPRRVVTNVVVAATVGALLSACGTSGEGSAPRAPGGAKVLVALPLRVDADALTATAASRSFVSLAQVADEAGASQQTVDAAVQSLSARGVDVAADPTRGALWGAVDVESAEEVFGVELVVETIDGARTVVPRGTPSIPDDLDGVTGVVGLTGSLDATMPASPGAGTAGCPDDPETASDLAARFGVAPSPDDPSGAAPNSTVAVLTIEQYEPAVLSTYAACVGVGPDASQVDASSVVPATPAASGGPELALDTLVIGLLAPSATIDVTRFDPTTSVVFPLLQVLDRARAGEATPDVLAFSVGYCETDHGSAELALAEWLLAALAATGTTAVAATGDKGSSACAPQTDAPAVQYPAASAWVVAVGGASFTGDVTAPEGLAVWNDTPTQDQAGGGGTSSRVPRPSWQESLSVGGTGVAIPDVVAYAEPSGFGALPVCTDASTCTWQQLGGTSLAVVGLAGLLAQGVATVGTRFGALSAALAEAGDAGRAPAIDVTVGDNSVFTTDCCTAQPGFDLASGWGLFDVTRLSAVASP